MGKRLNDIAQQLKDKDKKVQLIYAFNGNGKTRLSREFRLLVAPKIYGDTELEEAVGKRILYYNAFTEDLFYWDNDLEYDAELKLKIHPNSFTRWIFEEQGQDRNIISNFQHYTDEKLTPNFNEEFTVVTFSYERGNNEHSHYIKLSKGEESNFVWCVFYSLLEQVIDVLNVVEPSDRETNQFDQMEYVFIDDPVTSLDDNHLIQLAVDLAQLIKRSESGLKFVITTHNSIFYNVLHNEINAKTCYMLDRQEDGTFELEEKNGDSNKSFSYHLHLKKTIEEAIENNQVQKYHFTLLRNLYEKTASFLGFPKWSELLPENKQTYYNRIIQFTSHSTLANESVAEPSPQEKQTVKLLLDHLTSNYSFWKEV
ncbi:AAA family ATPase [Bacillus cereus]|uniref:AAA family ATPase n=1 Tax=Bacillus cereus TaxID=1396 RepID=UPI002AC0538C|nr:AAA family ATPase [Bacillus cereus]MDA2578016.1 AAA family ATPase [Bacillus cereus]MDZ4567022.1 AAA family ATPase [Bacillus cereus]HDR8258762.1 AAA family ATPase [Bacillus cereus]HDR8265255.1 AAA family ATPase [Bacillus cereus]HDR8269329.1 AAA family ATPase [Bacillus cereus]